MKNLKNSTSIDKWSIVLAILIAVVIGMVIGKTIEKNIHPTPPYAHYLDDKVWIEYRNFQHAIDNAARTGGIVCFGKKYKETNVTWIPSKVKLVGISGTDCNPLPRAERPILSMSRNAEHTTVYNVHVFGNEAIGHARLGD